MDRGKTLYNTFVQNCQGSMFTRFTFIHFQCIFFNDIPDKKFDPEFPSAGIKKYPIQRSWPRLVHFETIVISLIAISPGKI